MMSAHVKSMCTDFETGTITVNDERTYVRITDFTAHLKALLTSMWVADTLLGPPNVDLDTCIFTLLIDNGGKHTKLVVVPWNCLDPHSFHSSALLGDVEG